MKKSKPLREPITLGEVRGNRPMRLICQSLFNAFNGLEAYGCPMRYDDTVATYAINTTEWLKKARLAEVRTFVKGMLAGLSAAGII